MEKLKNFFIQRLNGISTTFKRYLYSEIDWNEKLIGIIGARGVGKTTLMLQYIKEVFFDLNEVLYVSLDNFYFSRHTLTELTETFVKYGGKYLFLDEVHKYPNWSIEIKNLYDLYPDLKIVFSASSVLQIFKGQADLSRRVALYNLSSMSLREYLSLKYKNDFPKFQLQEILQDHINMSAIILKQVKPLKEFEEYLRYGAYPFIFEGKQKFYDKLYNTVNQIFESDIPEITNITSKQIKKLKLLLYVISTSVPFVPNIKKISEKTGIDRKTVYQYLDLLERAQLIMNLRQPNIGITAFNKPEKIFLQNPNLIYVFAEDNPQKGNIRETFFYNQLKIKYKIHYTPKTDFLINRKYYFEIGGKNKDKSQIEGLENAYLALDNIETGFANKIPLWLFGFLY